MPHATRSPLIALLCVALAACGGDSKPAPGTPAPAAGAAATEWKTFVNPPPEPTEREQARHINFTLRYPATWTVDDAARKEDDRLFVQLERRTDKLFLELQLRSFKRAAFDIAPAVYMGKLLDSLRSDLKDPATLEVLSQGTARIGGVEGYEVVFRHPKDMGGLPHQHWWHWAILPLAATEWGALTVRFRVVSGDPAVDPAQIAAQGEIKGILDSLTITRK